MRCLPPIVFSILTACAVQAEDHWAYNPPVAVKVANRQHPVDGLLHQQRKATGTVANLMAEPRQWAIRASFSLTGLPPTMEQIERLEADPKQWPKLLDEWMASTAYGERWARHWMDVARYADTFGYNFQKDNRFPFAWTYREWLVDAFNRDIPWAQFIKLQIAADLVVDKPDHPDLAALGFLTVGPRGRHEVMMDDRVDVITRGFMSSTVSCARCHKHKTDPISMTDYYSFFSIVENADANPRGPVIGAPANAKAHEQFLAEMKKIDHENHQFRHGIVKQVREPSTLAGYLHLGWLAHRQNWELARCQTDSFKMYKLRGKATLQWKKFLAVSAVGDNTAPRLAQWYTEMGKHGANQKALCEALANEWHAAIQSGKGQLANQAKRKLCPLSYDEGQVQQFFTQKDGQKNREIEAKRAKLESSHPGGPPRAMVVKERQNYKLARKYKRGDPNQKSEPFKRHWLEMLGGGDYHDDESPRLQMAKKIADAANPLTARTIVNRVWAWHFGAPLVNPGDFGPQTVAPKQQELLDWLAVWFIENGQSLKKLHHLLLTSEAFRLKSDIVSANVNRDEANTTYWRWNRQRLSFEAMRDRLLFTSGSLDLNKTGGRSVELEKPEADERRTIYAFIDRFELPGQFTNFDLPHPDHHAPKRLETTVPQQALWFLNGALALRQAKQVIQKPEFKTGETTQRMDWLYQRLLLRDPTQSERATLAKWLGDQPKDEAWADAVQMIWASNEFHFLD